MMLKLSKTKLVRQNRVIPMHRTICRWTVLCNRVDIILHENDGSEDVKNVLDLTGY